jgi:hypothetical protein
MNIQRFFLIFMIVLISIFISILALGSGQRNCISTLLVSIASTEAISIDGFTIEVDGDPMATTRNGAAVIDLSELSSGDHRVKAFKDEGEDRFEGFKDVNIPCINASVRGQQRITVPVKLILGPSDDGPKGWYLPPEKGLA